MSVFLSLPEARVLYRDAYFFIVRDAYPVSPGHSLIISNQVRADYFALTPAEQQHLPQVLRLCRQLIEQQYTPDGYNIGMNCGEAAGQTVPHFHCHVIPRYGGDMADPRGGIRHCVAGKGYYAPVAVADSGTDTGAVNGADTGTVNGTVNGEHQKVWGSGEAAVWRVNLGSPPYP